MPAPLEPDTTPEEHRQRALLRADLGRYDEAADEIGAALSGAGADGPEAEVALRVLGLAFRWAGSALGRVDGGESGAPALAALFALEDALAFEAEQVRRTGASADHRSAVEAFLAKRRPELTGR